MTGPSEISLRRVIVALDITSLGPDAALSLVLTFCRMFTANDPVELALHVYAEPRMDHLHRVRRLVSTTMGDVDQIAPMVLYSLAELHDLPYDAAFAASLDPVEDARTAAEVMHAMHALRTMLDSEPDVARARSAPAGRPVPTAAPRSLSRHALLARIAARPRRASLAPSAALEQAAPSQPPSFPEGHFYAPTVDARDLESRAEQIWVTEPQSQGVDFDLAGHRTILAETFPRHLAKFDYPRSLPDDDELSSFFVDNSQFSHLDCRALFVFLHEWRPRRVIEVGSGYSTLLMADVNRRWFDQEIDITAIEPYPRPFLERGITGVTRLIKKPVQEVHFDTFRALQAGDILFIDSSHVCKTGSDVNYLYLDVLPRLARGVRIHVHDIFLPEEYPKGWVLEQRRHWNEQYLLHALLMHSTAFRVIFGASFAMRELSEEVSQALALPENVAMGGGSFWFERL